MGRYLIKAFKQIVFLSLPVLLLLLSPAISAAEVSSDTMTQFTSVPINLTDNDVSPQVMLNASNDQQLFFKAYNDYSDLDDDGVAETTYKNSVDYYGYFDCYKCYEYDSGDQRFEPRAVTANKYCTGSNDAYWSGNFLNWATMTRIDAIRKILFGGLRRVDTSTETVLERAFLPPDIHSFAKHYSGSDVADLTPFTPNTTAPTGTSATNRTIGTGSKSFVTQATDWIKVGDYLTIEENGTPANYMKGWVTAFNSGTGDLTVNVTNTGGAGNTSADWKITNHTRVGITIANVTPSSSGNMSEDITDPPIIRVAEGNYAFWGSGEVTQGLWDEEETSSGHGLNYNDPVNSGVYAAQDNPTKALVGSAPYGDFVARIQVCVSGLMGQEKVKKYPYGNYKPVGLLQIYGDEDRLLFGMAAGTYSSSRTGGDMVAKIYNSDGASANSREINLGKDIDDDGDVDGGTGANVDDYVDANHNIGDGTFKKVYQTAGGPITNATKSFGIINTWSLMRIVGYDYGNWNYVSNSGDNCPLSVNFFGDASDSTCSNWGNPFSEIYLVSLRYFSGLQNSPGSYQVSTESIPGINYDHGNDPDPLTLLNYCARLNVINFNSSISSADTAYSGETGQQADQLDTTNQGLEKDLDAPEPSKYYTDIIGANEGIHGSKWFVGENNSDNNRRCTEKTITSLGDVRGLCPEGPDLRGGFRVAGLAYYAHINDIRPTGLSGSRGLTGTQKVDTYSVKMASGSPAIEIPIPGTSNPVKYVTILPASMTNNKNDYSGTLVDFKIIQPHSEAGGTGTGKFLAIWEDSLQGNDYDLDAGGTIEYTITATQIEVKTAIVLQNLGYSLGIGYVISGTTKDGLHIHSGTNNFNYTDPTTIAGCVNCSKGDGVSTRTYTIGDSTAGLLKDPLWYAAKWGGFTDSNNNNKPDVQSEWDKMNNTTGALGSDDIPDNYFYAANPAQLEASLDRVFLSILQRASSGTAAAVVANNVSGVGALYQAYYEPLRKDSLGNQATWLGTVQSLWLDSAGYLREDDGNATLDGYLTDPVIQMYYDDLENKTRVHRYLSTKDDVFSPYSMTGTVTAYDAGSGEVTFTVDEISGTVDLGPFTTWDVYNLTNGLSVSSTTSAKISAVGSSVKFTITPLISWVSVGDTIMTAHFHPTTIELEDVNTIWNAREQLSFSTADATDQRTFSDEADDSLSGGRYIKTWIDADGDSVVDVGEFIDFDRDSITAANFGFFNVATEAEAKDLTDYIRGDDSKAGYRNRTIDYDGDGFTETIRLGDIINSTPTVVGSPQERLDLLYKDDSYTTFKKLYSDRRQMVYVGGNDGMLHAFNGGFYDSDTQSFDVDGTKHDGSAAAEHPLGAEIWAYVPMNLLPHLKWLKDNNYVHVYYVDAKPKVFDAKIFNNDPDHPNGWGTVLVVGMRFGGGAMTIDTEANGLGTGTDRELKSAYIVMDITNPEEPPRLLAEIQVPDGSFSTSYPAAFTMNNQTTINKWFLSFGSGPTSIAAADSTQNAKFYAFDLGEILSPGTASSSIAPSGGSIIPVGTGGTMKILSFDTGIANSFVGDPISVDWDLNYKADGVYFGLLGDSDADSGRVIRFDIDEEDDWQNWTSPATLINVSQPVSSSVTPGRDKTGQKWIFFGTGRFYISADQSSTATQSIYGVKENGIEVAKTDLVDTSSAQVQPDGTLTVAVGGQSTLTDLENEIETNKKGWYLDLPPITGVAGTDPATRVLNASALAGGILFTTAYQPGIDPCTGEGYSRLYGLYYRTGTAHSGLSVFGTDIDTVEYEVPFINLGHGFATTPALHSGSETGDNEVTVFTQLSTGTIIQSKAKTGNIRSGIESWLEPE